MTKLEARSVVGIEKGDKHPTKDPLPLSLDMEKRKRFASKTRNAEYARRQNSVMSRFIHGVSLVQAPPAPRVV